jgi:hypothetical protein
MNTLKPVTTTRESHIYPTPVFLFVTGIFRSGTMRASVFMDVSAGAKCVTLNLMIHIHVADRSNDC